MKGIALYCSFVKYRQKRGENRWKKTTHSSNKIEIKVFPLNFPPYYTWFWKIFELVKLHVLIWKILFENKCILKYLSRSLTLTIESSINNHSNHCRNSHRFKIKEEWICSFCAYYVEFRCFYIQKQSYFIISCQIHCSFQSLFKQVFFKCKIIFLYIN